MAGIREEIQSIRDFIAPLLPDVKFHLQNMPTQYKANELAIELAGSVPTTETAFHYRKDRTYQIVYFGASKLDCVTKFEAVERKISEAIKIGALSVESFSVSQAFKTESGAFAIIGMLAATMREARPQPVYEPINEVTAETISKQDASSWRAIDDDYSFADLENGRTEFNRAGNGEPYSFDDLAQGRTIQIEEDE